MAKLLGYSATSFSLALSDDRTDWIASTMTESELVPLSVRSPALNSVDEVPMTKLHGER